MNATSPLTNPVVVYRLQGFLEIAEESETLSAARAGEMLSWLRRIPRIGPANAYVSGLLEAALIVDRDDFYALTHRKVATYLDTVFEHYVLQSYPGDPGFLEKASVASQRIPLKPRKTSPVALAYRIQGYLELCDVVTFTATHARLIREWIEACAINAPMERILAATQRYLAGESAEEEVLDAIRAALRRYFLEVIDPSYGIAHEILHPIHSGQTNHLNFK